MKMPFRARREVLGLLALCLLLGGGLFFFVRWRESPAYLAAVAKEAREARLDACRNPLLALSPSGAYLAAICDFKLPPEERRGSSYRSDLVVWSMVDGEELSRIPVERESNYRLHWASNEQLIGLADRFAEVFHWRSRKAVTNPIVRAHVPDPGMTDYDIYDSWMDMDTDVKVQSLVPGGLQAFRLSTGAPIRLKWRWEQDKGYTDMQWRMTLCPSKPGGPLHAIVGQGEEKPRPRPTPAPTPVPTPTPVLTPEQRAFLEKEKVLYEEVSQIVEKLQGDDPPSEEEAARLEARGNSIVSSLGEERKRLFPVPKMPARKPAPEPPLFSTVMRVDLKSGRVLWKRRIRTTEWNPRVLFSQDGGVIAVIGVKRDKENPDPPGYKSAWGRGIDFWSATTGKTIGAATLTGEIEMDKSEVHWLPNRVLFVHNGDADSKNEKMLFLQAHGGHVLETRTRPQLNSPDGKVESIDGVTVSANGETWVFATRSEGWVAYTDEAFRTGKGPFLKYH